MILSVHDMSVAPLRHYDYEKFSCILLQTSLAVLLTHLTFRSLYWLCISAYMETVIMLWLHDIVYCDIYSPVLSVLV